MTKKYLNLLLQNAKEYLSKTSKCLDNAFDYFLEYIEKIIIIVIFVKYILIIN
jgi:hypothetical protein